MSQNLLSPPQFDADFRAQFETLLNWRRDVRRFTIQPVPPDLIGHLLDLAQLSPSVGNSQPWRWVQVDSAAKRAEVRANFLKCNEAAQQKHHDERAQLYASLKLEGIDRAPLQFGIFCDHATPQGDGLGQQTMPETLDYSTVAMITTFWLAARAAGLGVGWVSIIDPAAITAILEVPPSWKLIAYLCVGWPEEEHNIPELVRYNWQSRTDMGRRVKVI